MTATYEELRQTFRLDVPDSFNFARDVVGRWAQERNRVAGDECNRADNDRIYEHDV